MTKIGTVFQSAAPNGWSEFQDGNRHVFHEPSREELIVCASLIKDIGATGDLTVVQRRLFQNAEQSLKDAVAHPALRITQPFQKEARASNMECWSLQAQTHEGNTVFYQVVFRDPRGVLLATLEAPNTACSLETFNQFIKSVGVVSESQKSTATNSMAESVSIVLESEMRNRQQCDLFTKSACAI